jgi:uncharacterized OB-fold protein
MSGQSALGEAAYFPASRPWSEENGALRLHGSRCASCGESAFPPHSICPQCGSASQEGVKLSPAGTLYTYSEIHVAPKGFNTPYAVAYVDLPEGVRVFGQVEQRAVDLTVGQTMRVVLGPVRTDPNGQVVLSYKFRGEA